MNAYVVAPSCEGAGSQNEWLPTIEEYAIAITGYTADDNDGKKQIGHRFASIQDGDLIIIANGKNKSKSCYFAGFAAPQGDAALAKRLGVSQVRKLRSFTSLRGEQIPFSTDCKHGNTPGPWIDACYMLDQNNPADRSVVDTVLSIIAKAQGARMVNELINLLAQAKQIVFTGAPGTGKTYLARQIAMQWILGKPVADENKLSDEEKKKLKDQMGFVQFHPSFDYSDFVEGLRPVKSEDGNSLGFERRDGVFKAFCKRAIAKEESNFDEAYAKLVRFLAEKHTQENPLTLKTPKNGTEFRVFLNSRNSLSLMTGTSSSIQGSLTPDKIKTFLTSSPYSYWEGYYKGVISYMQDHCQLTVVKRDENTLKKPYVFIIDEINRGDISKIFGELFFAMDKGYRGNPGSCLKTQYNNLIDPEDPFFDGFYVPDNVYIIGTMNDIDRNVESMDFAIRRRFTWKEITPSARFDDMWSDLADIPAELKEGARRRMNSMNAAISSPKNGLGTAYQIGPAYFRELVTYKNETDGGFVSLWLNHLEPLLREYLRGMPNADRIVDNIRQYYEEPPPQDGGPEEGK